MNQMLTLFLYRFTSLVDRNYFSHKARNFLLGRVSSSAHGHELFF
jgi:hypothetical protein